MSFKDSPYSESSFYACFKSVFLPILRHASYRCVKSIFLNFFFRQYRCALLPGRVPVTDVDHPLDEKIPFVPSWVTIYLDFVNFWVRMLSFLLRRYGRKAYIPVRDFIKSMGDLYAYAVEVYSKNLSTTKRPFYITRPRFFLIHLVDPHLMCIPSLHVMVVIRTYTFFQSVIKSFGDEKKFAHAILEVKQGALAISQAILFVKQHSVNCIPAALYAMTNFSPELFPPEEAETFTGELFSQPPAAGDFPNTFSGHPSSAPKTILPEADKAEIKAHILYLYRRFIKERETAASWDQPLLSFLRG